MLKASKFLLIPILGIFLFFLGLNVDYVSASDLRNGLVGYWKLDNGATIDYSGRGNDLINNNVISTKGVSGIDDTAFDFENANSSHLYISDDNYNGLDVAGDMSVSAWVNFESFPKKGDKYVIVAKFNEGGQRSYFYSLYNNDDDYSLQAILSGGGSSNTADLLSCSPCLIATSTWYHFIWVYDSCDGKVSFFVNGLNIGNASGAPNNLYNSNVTFQIGGYDYGYQDYYFDGSIDEVRIYNRVLSEEEIEELYNQFNSPSQPENFSFVHMTDPHIGSSWIPGHIWYEKLSYPRFTDGLYEIGQLAEKPDFVLMSGDAVEYAKTRWLKDYQSIINSFTAQTNIPVYTVPGNHDRYKWYTGSFFCDPESTEPCGDELEKYKQFINDQTDLYFTHKGVQFIGLDTGADYMPDYELKDLCCDKGIEGDGLTDDQMSVLEDLDSETPKVVFMHHPVFTGAYDTYSNPYYSQSALEDASFANNHDEFVSWGEGSNLQLVLAGHTHRAEIYDVNNKMYSDINSASGTYPLFIQTQSATHDGSISHGCRLVDVENGAVNPRDAFGTKEYIKLISQLDAESDHEFRLYDPNDDLKYIKIGDMNGLSVPFFTASSSKRLFMYGLDENSIKLQVLQKDFNDKSFDLNTRVEGVGLDDVDYENDFGYRIGSIWNRQFVHFHLENKSAEINAKNISFENSNRYQFKVDWDELIKTKDIGNLEVMNDFNQNSGEILSLEKLKYSIIAKLFSPAELVIIDTKTGSGTGVVNHESIEEIDYSLSDEARERVLIYDGEDLANKDFIYRVQGLEDIYGSGEDDFSLKIVYRVDDKIIKEVNIFNMPINASTTYQFYVDWENLSDISGVIMKVYENGDEILDKKFGMEIYSLSPYYLREKIILNLQKLQEEQTDERIDFLISLVDKSMNQDWWDDDYYLNQKKGDKVFKADLITIQKLRLFLGLGRVFNNKKYIPEFIEDKFKLSDDVRIIFENVLDNLLQSDIILTRIAINDFAADVNSKKDDKRLKIAKKKFEKAKELLHNQKIQVVQFCRQAWKMVN
ncbi:MAG: LamG-like jellyroll fold domain-containing protein [Patescibacteria group bacterium]|nr:LamG-like jellyroll fold domain-containing protein [Patescibacteria group bacterium]